MSDSYDDRPGELTPEGLLWLVVVMGIPWLVTKLIMVERKQVGEVTYAFNAAIMGLIGAIIGTFAALILWLIASFLYEWVNAPLQLPYPSKWFWHGWWLICALYPTWMIWLENPRDRRVGRYLGRGKYV